MTTQPTDPVADTVDGPPADDLTEMVAQAMRDANSPAAWVNGPQILPMHHFAGVAITALVERGWGDVSDLRAQVATLTEERDAALAGRRVAEGSLQRLGEALKGSEAARLAGERKLAERTRERDEERTAHDRTRHHLDGLITSGNALAAEVPRLKDQLRFADEALDQMRPVVEAAIAMYEHDRAARAAYASTADLPNPRESIALKRAVLAAVERYQHPAVTVSPDDGCTCVWNNGYLRKPWYAHRPGCPAAPPSSSEPAPQSHAEAQEADTAQDLDSVPDSPRPAPETGTGALEAAIEAAARAIHDLECGEWGEGCTHSRATYLDPRGRYARNDRDRYQRPPCPRCDQPTCNDWIDATELGDAVPMDKPNRHWCVTPGCVDEQGRNVVPR